MSWCATIICLAFGRQLFVGRQQYCTTVRTYRKQSCLLSPSLLSVTNKTAGKDSYMWQKNPLMMMHQAALLVQTFFVSAISGSISAELTNMLNEPDQIVNFLANALPAQSNYFLQVRSSQLLSALQPVVFQYSQHFSADPCRSHGYQNGARDASGASFGLGIDTSICGTQSDQRRKDENVELYLSA